MSKTYNRIGVHRSASGTKAARQTAAKTGKILRADTYKPETPAQREIREWNEAVALKKAMKTK